MSRSIVTVSQAWEEYSNGLDGNPSLQELEEQGGSWRKSQMERLYYLRRLPLFKAIQKRITEGEEVVFILSDLENQRGQRSLYSFCNILKNKVLTGSDAGGNFLNREIPPMVEMVTSVLY
jgi:hypothetical protein